MSPLPSEPNLLPAEKGFQLTILLKKVGLPLLLLFTTGWILSPLEENVWGEIKENISPAELKAAKSQTGQGLVMATLGGFRSVVADIHWLRTMVAWEKEDKDKTIAHIQFTVTLDPRPTFFWLNGARMMAYDMRHWNKDPTRRRKASRRSRMNSPCPLSNFLNSLRNTIRTLPYSSLKSATFTSTA